MEIKETGIEGLYEIIPRIFPDSRGYFFEVFRESALSEFGLESHFVQENQSYSFKNVIRGLHIQLPPYEQLKLVRVTSGKILDIAVDIRPDSSSYGKYFSVELSSEKGNMLYVPKGFLHGFAALENSVVSYKCSDYYNKESESGVRWNDKEIGIEWGVKQPIISKKDQELPTLRELSSIYEVE